MAFHEVRFPDNISRGARGGPQRKVQIVELASGAEERNASWADSRRRFDVAYGIRRADDLQAVVAFFEARGGRLYGFRYKDWADYTSCLPSRSVDARDQVIGSGDGSQRHFRLSKRYGTTEIGWTRAIRKPVTGSVKVALADVEQFSGWEVNAATGVVAFDTPPEPGISVTAGFAFDVPVRFDSDIMDVTLDFERGVPPPSGPN
jgi:uncharacterized protein (TIGR02217 family)